MFRPLRANSPRTSRSCAPPAGAIVSSVTTDQPVYQDGETVTMTFTETNESAQPVMVPTGQNGFAFDQVLAHAAH